jgi:hypothetical protein
MQCPKVEKSAPIYALTRRRSVEALGFQEVGVNQA